MCAKVEQGDTRAQVPQLRVPPAAPWPGGGSGTGRGGVTTVQQGDRVNGGFVLQRQSGKRSRAVYTGRALLSAPLLLLLEDCEGGERLTGAARPGHDSTRVLSHVNSLCRLVRILHPLTGAAACWAGRGFTLVWIVCVECIDGDA
ncbi:hypothetical protein E2C01_014423 [Portunus trituberculatus]|uniref:Uncharacterized protein n=1 Tax=Portunus trituberculatus TaxID=210409 RepID=A0A5B7DJZ8_PORTR|nr:hypothetical protein [Portunus trituberculatus]